MTQSQLLQMAVEILERLEIRYALVGSLASSTLGEARFTNDIDIVVDLDVFDAARLCDAFDSDEFYVYKPTAIEAAVKGRQFNVLHSPTANKIDFMLPGDSDWAKDQLDRRRRQPVLEAGECYVASPEDIILGKLLYYQDGGSEKHLRDIAGICKRKSEQLDMPYLESKVRHLRLQQAWHTLRNTLEQS